MKLSDWAKEQKLYYGTALRWFHEGNLPCPAEQLSSGTILVYPERVAKEKFLKTYIYVRVSSAMNKANLDAQAGLCEQFCISKGWNVEKVIKEISSGMNDNRPKLNKLLDSDGVRIVCLHKDRLTRFGYNYVNKCVNTKGGEVVIINSEKTDEDDLLKDFVSIITSFCCRLYGARRGQAKALKVKEVVRGEDP